MKKPLITYTKEPGANGSLLNNIPGVQDHDSDGKGHLLFDEQHALQELKHFLPTQTPLKDFIHHNTLHAFQQSKFYDALFRANNIFGYQVTLQLSEFRQLFEIGRIRKDILEKVIAERKGTGNLETWKHKLLEKNYDCAQSPRIGRLRSEWKNRFHVDLDNLVQPLLFRILCSYLDQGIALWKFPLHRDGFAASIRHLEQNSYSSFFKTKRAREILLDGNYSIHSLLSIVAGNEIFLDRKSVV